MNYSVNFPLEQVDFSRYIFHSALYNAEALEKANIVIKADLLNFMRETFGELKGVINVNVLQDGNYKVILTLNLDTQDVYYVCRYQNASEYWQALLMFGDNNANHIDKLEIDNEKFNNTINKPIKFLMIFCYSKLKEFLINNINELKDTTKSTEYLMRLYEDSVNKVKQQEEQSIQEEKGDSENGTEADSRNGE